MRERIEGHFARTSGSAVIGAGQDIEPRGAQVHLLGESGSQHRGNRLDPLIRARMYLCILLTLSSCRAGPSEEITSTKPYADLIGAKYSVIADNLYAYGVHGSTNDQTVSYVTLVPRGQIDGPEFAFRRNFPKGQVMRILSAWRHPILLQSGVYYLVAVESSDLPEGIPVRLELFRGNESIGADLNQTIYKKLSKHD